MQPSNGGKLQAPPCSSRNRTAWSDIPKTELGQRRRSQHVRNESAYPPIAAGEQTSRLVGSVPRTDSCTAANDVFRLQYRRRDANYFSPPHTSMHAARRFAGTWGLSLCCARRLLVRGNRQFHGGGHGALFDRDWFWAHRGVIQVGFDRRGDVPEAPAVDL